MPAEPSRDLASDPRAFFAVRDYLSCFLAFLRDVPPAPRPLAKEVNPTARVAEFPCTGCHSVLAEEYRTIQGSFPCPSCGRYQFHRGALVVPTGGAHGTG